MGFIVGYYLTKWLGVQEVREKVLLLWAGFTFGWCATAKSIAAGTLRCGRSHQKVLPYLIGALFFFALALALKNP